ncbi:MAG: hypothetical protein EBY22_16420 [Gammaproteobacteria bacterium]|nr:hypothetical protein [Gammaproteobacteria bacterium]
MTQSMNLIAKPPRKRLDLTSTTASTSTKAYYIPKPTVPKTTVLPKASNATVGSSVAKAPKAPKPEKPLFSTDGETDSPSKRAAMQRNRERWAKVRQQARRRFEEVAAALAKKLPF